MIRSWWVEDVTNHLQRFYEDWIAGKRPKMALMAPPQHGKSWAIEDFVAWVAGRNPDKKTIFASYSDDLGVRVNSNLQRTFNSDNYRHVFGKMRIDVPNWQCNNTLIEYAFQDGSFRNTTVKGQITGHQLHLGIIDDPVKGRQEVASKLNRDATWLWFTDDYMSRFAADGALLVIMTRWHVDDMLGRFIARFPDVQVLRYPAIAVHTIPITRSGCRLCFSHW